MSFPILATRYRDDARKRYISCCFALVRKKSSGRAAYGRGS